MSNRNGIHVKTCKLNWTFGPTYIVPDLTPNSTYSPEFFATNDVNLRWRFELDRERQFCGAINIILGLRVWYESAYSSEVREQTPVNRGPIAGEATIGIKFTTFNSVPKCFKCPFVSSEENLILNTGANNFLFRYTIGQITSVVLFSARLTCEVSYLNMNDALPILISNKYGIVAVEGNSLIPPVDGGWFEEMYLNKEYSDVTLCVNGTDYHAHKMVLAAHSKVFKAMFQHDMLEKKLNRVQIQNINEQAFLQGLRYMYTGRVEHVQTLAYDLLPVADRYDIEGLKKLCESVLHGKLELNTVVNILLLADSYNVDDLKARAIQFMMNRSKDVLKMMTAKERKEIRSRPDLMMELFDILMTK